MIDVAVLFQNRNNVNRFDRSLQMLPAFNPIRLDSQRPRLHYLFLINNQTEMDFVSLAQRGFGSTNGR